MGTHVVCMTTFLMIHQLMPASSSWSSDFEVTIADTDNTDIHFSGTYKLTRVMYPLTALNRHVVIAA